MINTNLKFWRRELSLTQAQLADKLGIKRSLIGAYEEGRAEPKLTTLVKMARLFGISLDALVTTDFSKKRQAAAVMRQLQNVPALGASGTDGVALQAADTDRAKGENLRVLALTVDKDQNENIELVPLKAAAGYLNGNTSRICPSSACPCWARRVPSGPSKSRATLCCPLPRAPSSWAATWPTGTR
jgi:transcriptional regulator with XRE-family HTH domain